MIVTQISKPFLILAVFWRLYNKTDILASNIRYRYSMWSLDWWEFKFCFLFSSRGTLFLLVRRYIPCQLIMAAPVWSQIVDLLMWNSRLICATRFYHQCMYALRTWSMVVWFRFLLPTGVGKVLISASVPVFKEILLTSDMVQSVQTGVCGPSI